MKLIVGLGNIGDKYKNNRHNTGFVVLDKLQAEISKSEFLNSNQIQNSNFKFQKRFHAEISNIDNLILMKPTTLMNDSGIAVGAIATYYKLPANNIYVIHDDLDIKLGEYKIQIGVGPKLHYGIRSVNKALNTDKYWRIRVGVDNRDPNSRIPGEEYVLQDFSKDEIELRDKVIHKLLIELINLISK